MRTTPSKGRMQIRVRNVSAGLRGFTLVELLVGLTLFGLLGVATTKFLVTQGAFLTRDVELLNARQNVRAALRRLSADIKLAGQGLNFYDLQVPDLIVPNDGSGSVNTFSDAAISLISIPNPASPNSRLNLDPGVPGNGAVGSQGVTVAPGSDLEGLTAGVRIILFNPNGGDSQVVALTGITGMTLQFLADTLVFGFPAVGTTPSTVLKLNEVRYRVSGGGQEPYLERRANEGSWVRYVEGIERVQFSYADSGGSPLQPANQAERRAIRLVTISVTGLTLRVGRGGESRVRVTLVSKVVPRNMLPIS